jgi:hypothetical protein
MKGQDPMGDRSEALDRLAVALLAVVEAAELAWQAADAWAGIERVAAEARVGSADPDVVSRDTAYLAVLDRWSQVRDLRGTAQALAVAARADALRGGTS